MFPLWRGRTQMCCDCEALRKAAGCIVISAGAKSLPYNYAICYLYPGAPRVLFLPECPWS
uniref:Uncharacterized protein n=1 Tax=Anguilla anguilla TaxID=7936 RepID=A0A0E9WEA9_ANGAN